MATEPQKFEQLQRMTRRPSTPGEVAGGIMKETGLTQTELARRIGVSRVTVNELIRGRRSLTTDMAHRLGRFFGNGPGVWLRMQANVDLWDALRMDSTAYAAIEPWREAA